MTTSHPVIVSSPGRPRRQTDERYAGRSRDNDYIRGVQHHGEEISVPFNGALAASPEEVSSAVTTGTSGWFWPIDYEPTVNGKGSGLTEDGCSVTA